MSSSRVLASSRAVLKMASSMSKGIYTMRHKSVNRKVTPVRENNKSQGWDLAIAQADKKIEALQSAKAAFEEYQRTRRPVSVDFSEASCGWAGFGSIEGLMSQLRL